MDVDARNGGEEALAKLPPLPKTVMAQTNDGYHYWFRTDKPFPSTTRPDGIELKGAGAYVVVPPAPGRFWLRDPFDYEIAWAPEWLLPKPTEPVSQTEKRSREVITTWHKPLTGEVGILCKPYLSPVPRSTPGEPAAASRKLELQGLDFQGAHGIGDQRGLTGRY
jgi:hypothetical protein